MPVALIQVRHFWYCPNCRLEDSTTEPRPHSRFHRCPALAMVLAPMLPAGTKAKVVAQERGDYIGDDEGHVQLDANGRPIMSVITEREDGTDVLVFAPTAHARIS